MRGGEARFYLELAESLGMTKKELLTRMDSAEITEWKVLARLRQQERKTRQ